MNRPISVMLADDQDLIRLGLRTLFDAEDGFEVVAEAQSRRPADTGRT